MNPPGHLAVAALVSERDGGLRACIGWIAAGAIAPDALDKALMLAGAFPWGRTVGHAALAWLCLAALASGPAARAFVVGGLSHLFADLADDAFAGLVSSGHVYSAWALFPFATADDYELSIGPRRAWSFGSTTSLEVAAVAVALFFGRRRVSSSAGATSRR
jgi:hypothetical protein